MVRNFMYYPPTPITFVSYGCCVVNLSCLSYGQFVRKRRPPEGGTGEH